MSDVELEQEVVDLIEKLKELTTGMPRAVILGAFAMVKTEIMGQVSKEAIQSPAYYGGEVNYEAGING